MCRLRIEGANMARYPSLLESSDIDGGSSVAVLTYLRRILESVDHPDMINLILHYLLALPDAVPTTAANSRNSVSAARKRKSVDLATMMASQQTDMTATPLLFNLVDLILACLRSHSQQTIHVTLQLVSAVLKRHHRYAVITLLHTESVRSESAHRTVGAHEQELEFLMTLAGQIGGQDNFDDIYDNILRDTTVRLESHPCSLKLVVPKTSASNHKFAAVPNSLPGAPKDVHSHTLRPDDPVLNIVLDRLETFYLNPVETNLALTEVIFDLAMCGWMNIEGWFLRNPREYVYDEDNSTDPSPSAAVSTDPTSPAYAEHQRTRRINKCRRRPQWTSSSLPRLVIILQSLVDHVAAYRGTIPRFDDLLQQRREAFRMSDAEPAPPPPPPPRSPSRNQAASSGMATPVSRKDAYSDSVRSGSPASRPSGLEGFAQRILSEFGTPTRSASPRGRAERSSTTSATALSVPPKEFPFNLDTPSRSGVGARADPPLPDPRSEPVVSQVRGFEAVDQSILARRVGIPTVGNVTTVEPIPLTFGKGDEAGTGIQPTSPVIPDEEEEAISEPEASTPAEDKTATVSHVLTNVIILQNFILELASLVQVRAGLFDEVRFA
jgi:hypothetical protein